MKETSSGVTRIGQLVHDGIARLWPARSNREALLDLGEHKGWTDTQFVAACGAFTAWLDAESLLPDSFVGAEIPAAPMLPDVSWLLGARPTWTRIAQLVGASPATFANSRTGGWRIDRPAHLWTITLARLPPAPGDLLFHQRTLAGESRLWGRLAASLEGLGPDAWDGLHLFSLLSLYQRRRATHEVRANRGRTRSRRLTPKPIVFLEHWFPGPGVLVRLERELRTSREPRAPRWRLLLIELVLARAHLLPHRARGSGGPAEVTDEQLLSELLAPLSGPERSAFDARIEIQRAYAQRRMPEIKAAGAYFELKTLLARSHHDRSPLKARERQLIADLIDNDAPGTLMLRPMLRRRLEPQKEARS